MVKSFLIIISLQIFLYSSEQIILVISEKTSSTKARLCCFEGNKQVFEIIDVNLGKNGLGIGVGITSIKKDNNDTLKYEGDKRAPIGIFKLTHIFGYKKEQNFNMPYLHADKSLICVDDSNHKNYNQVINIPSTTKNKKPNSFEYMKRDDHQYELGIIVEHNKNQIKQRGSCIFLHVQKHKNAPTSGCTSMKLEDIKQITKWLDISKKPILIQIPKSKLHEIYKLYPQLIQ